MIIRKVLSECEFVEATNGDSGQLLDTVELDLAIGKFSHPGQSVARRRPDRIDVVGIATFMEHRLDGSSLAKPFRTVGECQSSAEQWRFEVESFHPGVVQAGSDGFNPVQDMHATVGCLDHTVSIFGSHDLVDSWNRFVRTGTGGSGRTHDFFSAPSRIDRPSA